MPLGQVICKRYEPICVALESYVGVGQIIARKQVFASDILDRKKDVGTCRSFAVAN